MSKAKKINVYLNQRLETELQHLADRYGVSVPRVLLIGYDLVDRQRLLDVLELHSYSGEE